ncbi:MAG: AEC family transporter [Beijerinckiaceae bacterium]
MSAVFESLIPVLLIIATGYATRAAGFIKQEQWNGFETVTYQILLPALIMTTLAMSDLSQVPIRTLGITLMAPPVILSVGLLLLRTPLEAHFAINGPKFTSVFQGVIRWNAFIAIALASSLYGKQGLAIAAVAVAFLIPYANLTSAWILSIHGSDKRPSNTRSLLLNLIKNPFIWSTAIGTMINLSGIPIPKTIASYGDIVGRAALAAGLLMVGSGLDLKTLTRVKMELVLPTVSRLLIGPALTGLIGSYIGLTGISLAVPVLCAAVPTAAASYILARQNGGDATLMASIITLQTVLAAVTLPIMLSLFG